MKKLQFIYVFLMLLAAETALSGDAIIVHEGFIPNRTPLIWILAIGTILLAVTFYFPLIGGVLLLASIPLPFKQHILTSTIYPCDLVFPVVFVGWLIHRILTGQVASLKGRKVFLFFLPLLFAGIVSGLNAKDMFRYVGYLYLWGQMPFAYLMVVNIIKSRKHLNIILYTIFTVCMLFSLFYIFSFLYHYFRYFPSLHKVFSLSGNIHKNVAAPYIGLALPLFLGVFFLNPKAKLKIPLFILIAICFSSLVFTGSRLGVISSSMGMVLLIFVFALTKDKDKTNHKVILSCIILLYLILFIYLWFFARDLFMRGWNTSYARISYYKWAFKLFKEHPIIGLGLGNFLYYTGIKHPHSMVMQILAEAGLLGIAGILFLLWNLIKHLLVTLGSCASRYRYIIWAGLACLICFFIDNIFDFTLFHGMGIQVGVILALIDSGKKWNT